MSEAGKRQVKAIFWIFVLMMSALFFQSDSQLVIFLTLLVDGYISAGIIKLLYKSYKLYKEESKLK